MLASDCAAVLESDFADTMELEVPSGAALIREVINDILNHVSKTNLNMQSMHLVIEEALSNAMEHGNKFDHSKTVFIKVEITNEALLIRIRDRGKGFDHNNVPDPRSEAALWNRRGRGIFLMRAIMDEVIYTRNGSEVTLVKNL